MYRLGIEKLKSWKESLDRLPLILLGARQVGKTWLLKEFGETCFDDVCYINFEEQGDLRDLFEGSVNVQRLIDHLGAIRGKKIEKEKTLIVFDEIQNVPRALTSLKYFAETAPEYAICCAGSMLGITLHQGASFPVGKVEFMYLQPMSFQEFLIANHEEELIQAIKNTPHAELPTILQEKCKDYLKQYIVIGGMPKVVSTWLKTRDFNQVRKGQNQILQSYRNDFSKHPAKTMVPKIIHVWDSIPSQLAKPNKKFIYGLAKEGARAREYEDALLWLQNMGIVNKINQVTGGRLPLKAYVDLKAFKLYFVDVGLLCAMCDIDFSVIVNETRIFSEYNGTITEQFVLQELKSIEFSKDIFYWSENATSEVDFIFSYKDKIIPVEAKAGLNVHAQSLKVFRNKYNPQCSIRTSLRGYKQEGDLYNVPLYGIWVLPEILN